MVEGFQTCTLCKTPWLRRVKVNIHMGNLGAEEYIATNRNGAGFRRAIYMILQFRSTVSCQLAMLQPRIYTTYKYTSI